MSRKLNIETMRDRAAERGGECLSDEYVNQKTKLRWRCGDCGHEWDATPDSIKCGSWCPECARRKRYLAARAGITIEAMDRLAGAHGGKCLSSEYKAGKTHLRWLCAEGHEWRAIPESIKRGSWCPECARRKKSGSRRGSNTIEGMRRLAVKRGGECLSATYVNLKTKLRWRCGGCGHEWEAPPGSVKSGTWCPMCAARRRSLSNPRRKTIEDMRELAAARGGECLSPVYRGANAQLRWCCGRGHEWEAFPNSIRRGTWCPECSGKKRKTIEDMRAAAAERGGACLSDVYVDQQAKLRWRCGDCGHEWEAAPNNVLHVGSWCPKCAGSIPPSLDEVRALARERGGACLSGEYVRNSEGLRWRCACGNQWTANWNNVKSGSWCPKCQSGLGERICRCFFEQLFRAPFPPARPDWLSTGGRSLELDGYCDELRTAFEHQGRHHFEALGFGLSKPEAKRRHSVVKAHDERKRTVCQERDVVLIAVPEIPKLLPVDRVRDFIRSRLHSLGMALPIGFDQQKIDLRPAYQAFRALKCLGRLQRAARARGGECLSDYYVNSKTALEFRCAHGHVWGAAPNSVLNAGSWCPECSGNRPLSIEEARMLAAERGGECLSEEYTDNKTPLTWRCGSCGHEWEAHMNRIKNGNWCPECWRRRRGASRRLGIEALRDLAGKRGGECVSEEYVNTRTALRWRCARGHEWDATPASVKNAGVWCPECRGTDC